MSAPISPTNKKPWFKKWWAWALAVLAVIVIALAALALWGYSTVGKMEQNAVDTCKADVTDRAKHPGGVEFVDDPSYPEPTNPSQGTWQYSMEGEVDFPNGFGTPVRHTYTCTVVMNYDEVATSHAYVVEQ